MKRPISHIRTLIITVSRSSSGSSCSSNSSSRGSSNINRRRRKEPTWHMQTMNIPNHMCIRAVSFDDVSPKYSDTSTLNILALIIGNVHLTYYSWIQEVLDERLTVLTLIRCCIEFCDSHMGEFSLMGLVAIWAAQVKSTPTVSVILQYSPKQVLAEYTILMRFRANQRNKKRTITKW